MTREKKKVCAKGQRGRRAKGGGMIGRERKNATQAKNKSNKHTTRNSRSSACKGERMERSE